MRHLAVLIALVVATPIVASMPRAAHAQGADVKKKLKDVRAKNEALKKDLAQKQAESQKLFTQLGSAESAAGLRGLSCHGVSSAKTPDPGYPMANVVHARLRVKRGAWALTPAFEPARASGAWRLYPHNCAVVKQ